MSETITIDKKLYDRLVYTDNLYRRNIEKIKYKSPFYTEVTATDEFGNVLFTKKQNETVLGGALTVLEKLCGIKSSFKVGSINGILNINNIVTEANSSATNDDLLCLWGIGIGGAGDAFGSRLAVKFYEREIGQHNHTDQMIPFRIVTRRFINTEEESKKYFMSRQRSDNLYEYYLKTFEGNPNAVTYVRWQDGAEGEDGTLVPANVYSLTRSDNIETYVELKLQLTKKDAREYFELTNQVEKARINTIGLFTGRRVEVEPGRWDYVNVKMFSKLNFENEALQNAKIINFTYRIYLS